MSMSTFVIGIKPADDKFKKMYEIYKACSELEIDLPDKVNDFFEWNPPDESGIMVDLEDHDCCVEYDNDYQYGYEVRLDKIPKDIKIVRFVNSC